MFRGLKSVRGRGPFLGFLPLEGFDRFLGFSCSSWERRRNEEEEEDGIEKGSSSTRFVPFLPFSIFPSLDGCISSSIYVLVIFLMV